MWKIIQKLLRYLRGIGDYPENCIKGIPTRECVLDDGSAASHLFEFKVNPKRNDGWNETSVNWQDDDNAIRFTMNQRKANGDLQFKIGVFIIPRGEIDRLNRLPSVNGILSYERQSINGNHYHGNILIRGDVPKPTMRKMMASIATLASPIIYQNQN